MVIAIQIDFTGGQPSADIAHERVTLELKGAVQMLDENLDLLGTHIHEPIRQDLMYKVASSGIEGTNTFVRCSQRRNRSGVAHGLVYATDPEANVEDNRFGHEAAAVGARAPCVGLDE